MSIVSAFDDVKHTLTKRMRQGGGTEPSSSNVVYFKATPATPREPSAFLAIYEPGSKSSAHFHEVDQFQIIVAGKGEFGRHNVSPYCVHFSRAHTPYGPLHSDKETGWTFMTLRARYDPGAQRLPGSYEKLKKVTGRTPWQVTKKVAFPSVSSGASIDSVPDIKDDQGLFASTLTMAPNAKTSAPDPSGGDGQFVVALKGSLIYQGKEHKAMTVVFVKPDEGAFQVQAGPQGLEGLILNFPRVTPREADSIKPSTAAGLKKWQCVLCAFAYDEALGMPGEGIAPGTRWEDVPESWTCPDCAAGKSDFEMIEV